LLVSPRRRRRLGRVAASLAAAGAVAVLTAALPGTKTAERLSAPVAPPAEPRPIHLTRADRAEITALLDRFVPAGVERRAPGLAYDLAAPVLRSDSTRGDWLAGEIPVYPYEPNTSRFDGWRVEYADTQEVGLELLLFPGPREPLGPIMFKVGVQNSPHGWRVSSFYPAATYAREHEKPGMRAHADWAPPVPRG
jgi:hypothetical protein